ncbi:response regulator transcription factor [Hathewaya limosa]|uniref:Stage 0 sporulation protein A homolog n=1 Tax=Hathewaya limosa TaxID=1536 RepID=A0ABU0JTS4_HATLI|nr:response regulator transcription factor [Hathewaya limosa]MDQ0480498.1 DNA-binding response OmpR family regulator [Hathewaya limosa]
MKKILVVDDEREIVDLIDLYSKNNYKIIKAYDGIEALGKLENEKVDLAIVDIMMPNMDGYNLIKNIRKSKDFPIIIISAKGEGFDKIIGLDLGADDYVTKPFDPLELMARVNAQLRRYNINVDREEANSKKDVITIGDLVLDKEGFSLKKNGEEVQLTSTEYKIVELFMTNPNKVFTKKNLFESVWNEPYFYEDNAIMVHISKVREKIEDDTKSPQYLKTIRGLGYRFEGNKDED